MLTFFALALDTTRGLRLKQSMYKNDARKMMGFLQKV